MSTLASPLRSIDAELLDRYFGKLTTAAETDEVRRWILAHPDHALVVESLRAFPLQMEGEVTTDTEAWLAQVEARVAGLQADDRSWPRGRSITLPSRRRGVTTPQVQKSGWSRGWYVAAVAASVVLLVVGYAGLGGFLSHLGWSTASEMVVYTTGNGERADITLPDGSLASLNVASRLEIPTTFGVGNRTLRLAHGEVLFSVVHRAGAPFTVVAGRTITRVLGTTFAVRRYATDSAVTVTVRDGRVAVQSHVLDARQEAVVDSHGAMYMRPANLASLSFTTGVLTLDDIPLRDAIVELDRWYDADIRLADSRLASERIRASFAAGSITDLSGMLEFMFGVKVTRNGRTLTISPRG